MRVMIYMRITQAKKFGKIKMENKKKYGHEPYFPHKDVIS